MPVAFARSNEIKIAALDHGRGSMAGRRARCQKKQMKSDDQRAPVTRYYLIKEPITRYEVLLYGELLKQRPPVA